MTKPFSIDGGAIASMIDEIARSVEREHLIACSASIPSRDLELTLRVTIQLEGQQRRGSGQTEQSLSVVRQIRVLPIGKLETLPGIG